MPFQPVRLKDDDLVTVKLRNSTRKAYKKAKGRKSYDDLLSDPRVVKFINDMKDGVAGWDVSF